MKVLVAEDETITCKRLERKLGSWGYEVVAVSDGDEAWQALQQEEAPRLVLMDWMMPGMSGLEICRRLRGQAKDSAFYLILLTSRDREGDIVAGLDAGADDYVTKPFGNNELRSRVNVGRRMILLQNELLEKEKLKGIIESSGAICHELSQPLQVFSGVVELLMMSMKPDDPLYVKMAALMEQTERMTAISGKLMKITRYETKDYLRNKIIDIDIASRSDA